MRNAARRDGDFDLHALEEELVGEAREDGHPERTDANPLEGAGEGSGNGDEGFGTEADGEHGPGAGGVGDAPRLLSAADAASFRDQWKGLQGGFVDEPRRAVEQADYLVDQVLSKLTEDLRTERDHLVRRWDRGNEDISTEELRQALRGYRTLLERLLRL